MALRLTLIITTLVAAALSSLATAAQPAANLPQVGYLGTSSGAASSFVDTLTALGYVEGQTVRLRLRLAEGRVARLPALATELVQLNVDVIVAAGVEPLAALRQATSRIPLVMVGRGDPVAAGLVVSLAKPGGNITGVTMGGPELAGKRLELLRETLPKLTRVGVLRDANSEPAITQEAESAARALNVLPLVFTVRAPGDLDRAFRAAVKERTQAILINESSMLTAHRAKLAELAVTHRLPAIGSLSVSAEAGLLMSYGPHLSELFGRAAHFVDKILKGAKPADLPFEQPTKFELIINLKTARTLGLTIRPSLLVRADQVIEQ